MVSGGLHFVAAGLLACACSPVLAEDNARAVVDRTRTTPATYAVYLWGAAISIAGVTEEHWSAEFHAGEWHRMEGPSFRVLANCRTHVGFFHDLATGKTTDAPNAFRGACGIYDAPDVVEIVKLPAIEVSSKSLDHVQITDATFVRQYAIDVRGAIIASDWRSKDGAAKPCVMTRAVAVSDKLPENDIFSEASLSRQVTPVRFSKRPAKIPTIRLSGGRCGSEL